MSYSDSQTPFMPPSQPYSDAIGVWPQYPMNNNEQQQFDQQFDSHSQFDYQPPPHKRTRYSDDNNQLNSSQYPPMNFRANPPNPSLNKGTANIFFKTRVCAKFRQGTCRNGENCNFAHGEADLRQPPPNWKELVGVAGGVREESERPGNWDDDQRIIHRMKLCKKFYNGEECPYGDRCNFLHEDPAKFREDIGRSRESSAISIGPIGSPVRQGNVVSNQNEGNKPVPVVNNTGIMKIYRKTKLCSKWETGQCPFGDKCNFAHGPAELQTPAGRTEGEAGNATSAWTKPLAVPVNETSPSQTVNVPASTEQEQGKKCLLKWKGPKKINRIYGDWLDHLPLAPNQVEGSV